MQIDGQICQPVKTKIRDVMIAHALYKLCINVTVQHYTLLSAPPHVKEITVTGIFITISC